MMGSCNGRTNLRVGALIDGTGAQRKGPSVIGFTGDRLETVIPAAEWGEPAPGDRVIDATHLTAVPGLIDCHVHFQGIPVTRIYPELADSVFETMVEHSDVELGMSDGIRLMAGVANARCALGAGITTARDCGGWGEVPFWLRHGVGLGIVPGPRILISGPIVTVTGGHGYFGGGEVDGADEARKMTRSLIKRNVDFIKVAATGGLATAATNPGHRGLSREELSAIVEEAHRTGRKVAAHILGVDGMEPALDAGVDVFEHVWFMKPDRSMDYREELLLRMRDAGVQCSPTPATEYRLVELIDERAERGIATEAEIAVGKWSAERVQRNLEIVLRMKELGILIGHGTDAGVSYIPFDDYALGLELLVAAGMSPMDALLAATRDAAQIVDVDAGTLEPGKLADIALVRGNPDEDISRLRAVEMTIAGGQVLYDAREVEERKRESCTSI